MFDLSTAHGIGRRVESHLAARSKDDQFTGKASLPLVFCLIIKANSSLRKQCRSRTDL